MWYTSRLEIQLVCQAQKYLLNDWFFLIYYRNPHSLWNCYIVWMILGLSSTTLVGVLLLIQRWPPSQEKVLAWEFIGNYIFFLADTMSVLLEYYVHWLDIYELCGLFYVEWTSKMADTAWYNLSTGPYGNMYINLRNYWTTELLDGHTQKYFFMLMWNSR